MGKKGKQKRQNKEQETQEGGEKMTEKQKPTEQERVEQITQEKIAMIQPKKVQYCPICSLPFQLCKFGKKAKDCKKFLQEAAPSKVAKYHPDSSDKVEENNEKEEQVQKEQKIQVKKQKSIKDKYVVIDVKQRMKKKFVTHISGLQIFKIDSKQLTKKLSKKFACSCSATDATSVQVQGDFYEDVRQILIDDYKVKKKYILSGEEFKQKFKEELDKKKEAKKLQQKVIKQVDEKEEEEKKEEEKPKYKTSMQQHLAHMQSDEEQDN